MKWQIGTVSWFDQKSGEGMIRTDGGGLYYVHYSAIESEKKWKTLKENKKVKFKLLEDESFSQILKIKEL